MNSNYLLNSNIDTPRSKGMGMTVYPFTAELLSTWEEIRNGYSHRVFSRLLIPYS